MKVRTKDQRKLYKLMYVLVKYIPPITVFLLVIHATLCLLGIDDSIMYHLVNTSIPRELLLIVASYAFGFCYLHRMCVIYNLVITTLININREIGLGVLLVPVEFFTVLAGIIILNILVTHWKTFKNCKGNARNNYKWTLRQS